MNLDLQNNKFASSQNNPNNIVLKFAEAWNISSTREGRFNHLVDLDVISNFEKQKSFTGAATATGSALADLVPARSLGFIVEEAGGFIDFMDSQETAESNIKFNYMTANGNFTKTTWNAANYPLGTTLQAGNEISAFGTGSITLEERQAIISGRTQVLAQSLQSAELLPVATQVLVNQKKLHIEAEIADAFALNASIVESVLGASTCPIHTEMKRLIGTARFKDESGQKYVFVMSYSGYAKLLNEKNTQNDFIAREIKQSIEEDERFIDAPIGYKGRFGGYKVYVSSGIRDTYTTAANRVTSLTGGTASLLGFGLPWQVKGGMSKIDRDNISVFDKNNSLPSAINGTTTFFMSFHFGQTIAAPQFWRYAVI